MKKILSLVAIITFSFFGAVYLVVNAQTTLIISNLRSENITNSGVQIRWTTVIPSDSKVLYGTSTANMTAISNSRCDVTGYVTDHCINLTGLTYSTIYYYKVESFTSIGASAFQYGSFTSGSSGSGGGGSGIPVPPSAVTAGQSVSYIGVGWTMVSDATHYNVYRSTNSGTYTWVYGPTGADSVPYTDTNVVSGSAYRYKVAACKSGYGCSGQTESNSVTFSNSSLSTPTPMPTPTPTPYLAYSPTPTPYLYPSVSPTPYPIISPTPVSTPTPYPIESITKTITGTVLFNDRQPVLDAEVGVYSRDNGRWFKTVVDSSGRYDFKIGGGVWQISVWPLNPSTAKWQYPGGYTEVNFARDNSPESKDVNITIPNFESSLIIRTLDENGSPIPGVGISVGAISTATVSTTGDNNYNQYIKTDSTGSATFHLRSGYYYARGFLPPESGYINPPEQQIFINTGDTKNITLAFKKLETNATLYIRGIAKLDDGRPIDAFVWAWSDKGASINTRSGINGDFMLQVTGNDRWHIGIGKELNGFAYKSQDIAISVENSSVPIEVILSKVSEVYLPPVTTTGTVSSQIVSQTLDGAKIIVPPNAVSGGGSVNVEVRPTIEAPSQAGNRVIGKAYDVTVKNSLVRK